MSFVVGVPKPFKRSRWGTKTFCQMLSEFKNFFNSSKIPSTLVAGIKNDYPLNVAENVWNEQDETCSATWKQMCSFWNYMSLIEIKDFNALIDHKPFLINRKKQPRSVWKNCPNYKKQWLHNSRFIRLLVSSKCLQTHRHRLSRQANTSIP